ncbi:MAG: DsbA family protein [Maricaulaceae bacterium]
MKFLSSTAIALSIFAFAGCAQAAPSQMERAEIESIIQDYLMKNPELVRDALEELDAKEEREAIAAVVATIDKDNRDIIIGPKNAKVTIVEFFDYNCGFCKRSTDWLGDVMDKHPKDVRVIFKELPILDRRTRTSRNASKAALAAAKQGKYREMHFALMGATALSAERIDALAKEAGVDVVKMRADMANPAFEKQIDDTIRMAGSIPSLTGTPYFIINNETLAGADTDRLQALLEAALEG